MGAAHFSICSFGDPTGYADVSPRNVHERLHQQHATRRQRKHHRHRQERMHPSTYDGRKQPISTWRSEAVTSRKPKSEHLSNRNFAQLILAYFPEAILHQSIPNDTRWTMCVQEKCWAKPFIILFCLVLNNNKQTYLMTRSH